MPIYQIAPSLLSANFAALGKECDAVIAAGADLLHVDVMDNHYVPNLTIGPLVVKSLREYGITAPIDVHLMVEPVDELIVKFAKVGASWISFHPEASKHVHRSLSLIRDHGCKAGLALNPSTSLSQLTHLIHELDFVLIMSVNPGFGGQHFIPSALDKIHQLRTWLDAHQTHFISIAVDGGVKVDNIGQIAKAGADTFIAGSAIFNHPPYEATINAMRDALNAR
jgi:ribulose-phosphate 3-epimerase